MIGVECLRAGRPQALRSCAHHGTLLASIHRPVRRAPADAILCYCPPPGHGYLAAHCSCGLSVVPGQESGGAQQVVRDGGAGQPGRIGGERARRKARERPIGHISEELLDDGVVAVLLLGPEMTYLRGGSRLSRD